MQDVNLKMKEIELSEKKNQPKKAAGVSFINQMPADKQNLMLDQQTLWNDNNGDNYNEELEDDDQKVQFIDETPIEDQDIEGMEYTTIDQKGISHFDAQRRDNEQNDFVPHV